MIQETPDPRLQGLYDRALARRAGAMTDIPVETVHALAAGTFDGEDRLALLDRVLGHPVLAAEFDVFADLEREAGGIARTSVRRGAPVLALAAAVALLLGAGLVWRTVRPVEDVARGATGVLITRAPSAGAAIGAGSAFVWSGASEAVSYRLRIIDDGGAEVFSRETTDTVVVLPADTQLSPQASFTWWVAATFPDGRTVRSSPVTVRTEPR